MPQVKFPDGSILVCGNAVKDAEFKTVGQKNSRLCKIGLMVGQRPDTTKIFVNVVAWHDLAACLALARKGDSVVVWGRLTEPREYNGKTYQDLQADWLDVASVHAVASEPSGGQAPAEHPNMNELDGDDGDLPF